MARGVNKVILLGNVGADPDVRFLPSGNPVCNLRIATSETWNDKQTGERKENTEWHSVVVFNKLAEIVQQYVHKGSRLYVEGKLRTRKWQDQSGNDRYSTEIVANDIQMLDSRSDGCQQQGGYQSQQQAPQQQRPMNQGQQQRQQHNSYQNAQNGYPAQQQQNMQNGAPPAGGFDDFDDEIPF